MFTLGFIIFILGFTILILWVEFSFIKLIILWGFSIYVVGSMFLCVYKLNTVGLLILGLIHGQSWKSIIVKYGQVREKGWTMVKNDVAFS